MASGSVPCRLPISQGPPSVLFLEGSPVIEKNATPVAPWLRGQQETLGSASRSHAWLWPAGSLGTHRAPHKAAGQEAVSAWRVHPHRSLLCPSHNRHCHKAQINNLEVRNEWNSTLPRNA